MASAKKNVPEPTSFVSWLIFVAAAALGPVLWWLGWPGFAAALVAVIVACWLWPVPMLTGKKDATGYPTPLGSRETRAMRQYQFFSSAKMALSFPSGHWGVGWPHVGPLPPAGEPEPLTRPESVKQYLPFVWSLVKRGLPDRRRFGIGLVRGSAVWALIGACFVVLVRDTSFWYQVLDAVSVWVLISVWRGLRRENLEPGDVAPAMTLGTMFEIARKSLVLLGVIGIVAGSVMAAFVVGPLGTRYDVPWLVYGLFAAAGFLVMVSRPWYHATMDTWLELVAARAEWVGKWDGLKIEPPPFLTKREQVGSAVVDTFTAPATKGAVAFYPMASQITPMLGAGVKVAMLSVPTVDSEGNPVPGTRHPLDFQIVTWPIDQMPNLGDSELELAVAQLAIQCGLVWSADAVGGAAKPIVHEVQPCSSSGEAQTWGATLLMPEGPGMVYLRDFMSGELGEQLNTDALVDVRWGGGAGIMYVGDLASTDFDSGQVARREDIDATMMELEWNRRWADVMKMGSNPPRPDKATQRTGTLADGTVINHLGFIVKQGVDLNEFFDYGPKLKTTLRAAPFVSVVGWEVPHGRPGERHPQAFTVLWSHDQVPQSPEFLAPPASTETAKWVLGGKTADAFKAARLAKPEVFAVRCLTAKSSRQHVWRIDVRLYGGVTLADLRSKLPALRGGFGSEWVRVTALPDGVSVVVGADPSGSLVTFADPKRTEAYVESLNWEQAWLAAKVHSAGKAPELINVDRLPRNEKVMVLDFELPEGIDFPRCKEATEKLKTNTNNGFVDVRRHPTGEATKIQVLTSPTDPMPERAGFDFEYADETNLIPFATGLEGEPVEFDPRESPHALLAGTTGSGKSVLAQNFLYGFLVQGCELYVIDPIKGGADFAFAKPFARAFASTEYEAAGVLSLVYEEVVRRKNMNAAAGVGSYLDLKDPPPPIVVMIDEFTSLMTQSVVPKESGDTEADLERAAIIASNAAKARIGTLAGKMAREARSAGVTLLLATQKLTAKMLDTIPGAGDLKVNLARTLLGNASFGDRASALRQFDVAPSLGDVIPKGRGLWESLTASAIAIQTWYAPQSDFEVALASRVSVLAGSQRIDVSQFGPPEFDVAGEIVDDQLSPFVEVDVVDLGEMDFGDLDLDDLAPVEMASQDTDTSTDGEPDHSEPQPKTLHVDWEAAEAELGIETERPIETSNPLLTGTISEEEFDSLITPDHDMVALVKRRNHEREIFEASKVTE